MQHVEVTEKAVDTRIVPPRDILSQSSVATLRDAERLSDRVSGLVSTIPEAIGRPVWRQAYREEAPGIDTLTLPLSRWPIEGDPAIVDRGGIEVVFGSNPGEAVVTGEYRHSVYRSSGWARPAPSDALTGDRLAAPSALHYVATYTAGYLMPGQVQSWSPGAIVTAGGSTSYRQSPGWATPSDRTALLVFEADQNGTTGATEPIWPTVAGATIADNGITWTAVAAFVAPFGLVEEALEITKSLAAWVPSGCVDPVPPNASIRDVIANSATGIRAYA